MKIKKLRIIPILLLSITTLTSCGAFSDFLADAGIIQNASIRTISLNEKEIEIYYNETFKLEATFKPSSAVGSVYWTSENKTIAKVDSKGLVSGVSEGETLIHCISMSNENVRATCKVKVNYKHVESVSFSSSLGSLNLGGLMTLNPIIYPEDAYDKTITFKSNNPQIIECNGALIRGLKLGNATITATANDGGAYGKITINVVEPVTKEIILSEEDVNIKVDDSIKVNASVVPSNAKNKDLVWESNNVNIARVNNGIITGVKEGKCKITVKNPSTGVSSSLNVEVSSKTSQILTKQELIYTFEDLTNRSPYIVDNTPNIGEPKFLIVPVWFTDSDNYITEARKPKIREDIYRAYLGDSDDNGWESVSSYYKKESRGQVIINGEVTPWWECKKSTAEVESSWDSAELAKNAVAWYKETNSTKMTDFDTNNDGYLDGVILIYGAPDNGTLSTMNSNMWAYCYWTQDRDQSQLSNPGANVFFWASYDFMYSGASMNISGSGDTRYCTVDAHTYIHETGHMFGLNDYYDYGNEKSPAGGFSMQDHNVGSHDPFSTTALGWSKPYIPTSSCEITIRPFVDTGDVILLSPNFNNSPFDEYVLLELYTPTGLNKFDTDNAYKGRYPQGSNKAGIRMWHVDARLAKYEYGSGFNPSTLTSIMDSSSKYDIAMSNTTYKSGTEGRVPLGEKYDKYNELQIISATESGVFSISRSFKAEDLWLSGDKFSMSKDNVSTQFAEIGKLDTKLDLGFEIEFVEVNNEKATLKIIKK